MVYIWYEFNESCTFVLMGCSPLIKIMANTTNRTKLVRPFNEHGKKTIVFIDIGIKQEG